MVLSKEIHKLKQKVHSALEEFSQGRPLLIGDDGKRENEVDLVFHAHHATKENVNLAITHAKGLLCVALDHATADRLGFYTSPRFPGGISHTNFTLSVDARENITSGISAKDRAHTIQLMAKAESTATDFITPGHVFPLRAMDGGLISRAGHTEALYELCQMSKLPYAAAMCEILGEDGEPITPEDIQHHPFFSQFTYLTTVDLLWYKVLYCQFNNSDFKLIDSEKNIYQLQSAALQDTTYPCAIRFSQPHFAPEKIRIVLENGFSRMDNGVDAEKCSAEIVLFSFDNQLENLPSSLSEFSDLSAKIGLKNTIPSVKRFHTLLLCLRFLEVKMENKMTTDFINKLLLPKEEDRSILHSIFQA